MQSSLHVNRLLKSKMLTPVNIFSVSIRFSLEVVAYSATKVHYSVYLFVMIALWAWVNKPILEKANAPPQNTLF